MKYNKYDMEVITMGNVKKMLNEARFVEILEGHKLELKRFSKRTARRCKDKSYQWEDFFQEAVLGMWIRFKKDKGKKRRIREYAHCAKWAIYHLLDKINADKRNSNRAYADRDKGIYFIREENG